MLKCSIVTALKRAYGISGALSILKTLHHMEVYKCNNFCQFQCLCAPLYSARGTEREMLYVSKCYVQTFSGLTLALIPHQRYLIFKT
jgi:hypothetical protein